MERPTISFSSYPCDQETPTQTCPETFIGKSSVGLSHMLARTLTYTTSKEPATTWNEATCLWPLLGASGTVSYTKAKELQQQRSRQPFANAPGSWTTFLRPSEVHGTFSTCHPVITRTHTDWQFHLSGRISQAYPTQTKSRSGATCSSG